MADSAQIELRVEFDVVDGDGNKLDSNDEKWEEAQKVCIEAIMEVISGAVSDMEFPVHIERE
jgi:hypothetical protein